MVCLHCGAKTHVINSRFQKRGNRIWRRRQCLNCSAVFTTEETPRYAAAWAVQASDGALQPFSRDKLMLSLYKSCGHRQTALGDAGDLADTIIKKLAELAENGRLWAGTIAQVTQVVLNRFDNAASVHYRAHHSGKS